VLFADKEEYLNSPYLHIGERTAVPLGVNKMTTYIKMEDYSAG